MVARLTSFVDVLRAQAAERPQQNAFVFLENGESEADALTYAELDRDARAIAGLLQQHTTVGDRALLLYPPGLDFVRAFMGCLYAGVVAVPVYPPRRNRTIDRLKAVAADAQTVVALTNATVGKAMGKAPSRGEGGDLGVPALVADRDNTSDPDAWRPPSLGPADLAFLQYTSGSTGTPKGVMITHGNLLHNNELIKVAYSHSPASVFVSWLPVFHDMGLIGMVLQPIYAGSRSVLMEPAAFLQKPVRWLRAITRYRGTTCGAPNSAYELCVRKVTPEDRATLDLSSWDFAYNGSEPVRASTVRKFHETFAACGLRLDGVQPCYGMAEATLLISIAGVGKTPTFHTSDDGSTFVSSGRTWLDERVLIVDPDTNERRAEGDTGEIWLASGSVAAGYWNRPDDTAAAFGARTAPDGDGPFFRTGDLGFMRGDQLFVTGRLKDLIIIRGRNLYPQDVEHTAGNAHVALSGDAAAAFAVASDAAEDSEQLVVVCEVVREQLAKLKTPESLHAVLQAVRQAVAEEHDVDPAAIVLLRTLGLPKTSSGKIQRRACRERFLLGTLDVVGEWRRPVESVGVVAVQSGASYEAVRDWLVARIAGQAGIAPDRVNLSDPFSRYGLDSQRAVILSGELQDWLGCPLPATIAYDFPSIDALARHLGSNIVRSVRLQPDRGSSGADNEPIAIVGIGCRFPGAATPEQFWDRLIRGVDAIGPAPASRPHAAELGHAGFLDDVEQFDAGFFGLTPREAEIMDPQQRLLLEVAWEAIESAGMPAERLAGSRTGVFIGISNLDYLRLQAGRSSSTDPYAGTGNALSIAANRLSYLFDLRGPSWAVDTACSSSLVAVHQACESLRAGESDAALCGGVNLILSPQLTSVFTRAGMMSSSHRCRTFDAAADGYVRGEGAAVVVLKRLSDAVRDGDTIHAVIRGSAVNQDGRSNGLTAPNGPAQQAVIRAALRAADVEPAQIGYVEAHGTGTPLGDPIEMNALMGVLGESRSTSARCAVGSLKTNIGHLEAAAGIAGLIKAVLVLQHRAIPPHLHFSSLNPHMALDGTAFVIPTTALEWGDTDAPRLAGVSSFGFGGTNAHVILEEPPPVPARASATERPVQMLTLSAKSENALAALAASTAGYLREHPQVSLANAAFTANTGRTVFTYRAAIVAASSADAAARLDSVAAGAASKAAFSSVAPASDTLRIAFLFTGQGSQFAGMAKDLFDDEPVFRRAMLEFDETFRAVSGASLLDVIYPGPEVRLKPDTTDSPDPEVRLKPDTTYDQKTTHDQHAAEAKGYVVSGFSRTSIDDTLYTQPALFAVECALARLWSSWGVEPDAVMGHSVGEFVAAAVAGLIDPHDGLRLVSARARLMQALPRNGSMQVVFADRARVEAAVAPYRDRVAIAANNGPSNTVISGETALVETIAADLDSAGIATSPLNTSHAFHSPLMKPMVAAFRSELQRVSFRQPRIPIVSNVTGRVGDEAMRDAEYWCRHILEPVQFADGIDTLHAFGARTFVEAGPRPNLIAMAKRVLTSDGSVAWVPSLQPRQPALTSMIEGAAMLWVRGTRVAWQAVDDPRARRRVSLPSYPFERQRFWIDESEPLRSAADPSAHPLLGHRLAASAHAPDTYSWESSLSVDRLPYLAGHSVLGSTVLPYAAFVEMALAASAQVSGGRTHRVTGLQLHHPVVLSPGERAQLQAVLDRTESGAWRFRVYNRVGSSWTLSSSAALSEAPTPHEIWSDVLCRQ